MSATAPGTSLMVVNRMTGEALDLRTATDDELVRFHEDAVKVADELADAQRAVKEEALSRLDRGAAWTRRVVLGGHQYVIAGPSPDAGAETYPPEQLEAVLRTLKRDDVIGDEAAAGALKRELTVKFEVPLGINLEGLTAAVRALVGVETMIGDTGPVRVGEADSSRRTVVAGVNRLKKLPAAAEALAEIVVSKPPSRDERAGKVKIKRDRAEA